MNCEDKKKILLAGWSSEKEVPPGEMAKSLFTKKKRGLGVVDPRIMNISLVNGGGNWKGKKVFVK